METLKEKEEKIRRTDSDQEKVELSVLKFFEEEGFSTKCSEDYNGKPNIIDYCIIIWQKH